MSFTLDLAATCEQATTWVRHAAAVARDRFRSDLVVTFKADRSLLTEVDLEVQARLTSAIQQAHPDHHVLGEEDLGEARAPQANNRYTWVIDPVDGTRNYAHGFPCFSTALALMDHDRPVIGVVFEPMAGQLFDAYAHGGTRLNGQAVHVAQSGERTDVLIGFPGGRNLRIPRAILERLDRRTYLRNLGSTCLHLAFVAAGALDVAYARKAKLWDVAAGTVLVAEAGGTIRAEAGRPLFPLDPAGYAGRDLPFIAAAPDLYEDVHQAVRACRESM